LPSSATSRGRLEKQGSGENSNTWGHIKLNGVLDLLDEQIDGVETIPLTVSPTTLTAINYASDQHRNKAYRFTGTGSFSVIMPATEWVKLFLNDATGTLTVSNGTNSTTIATGKRYWVASDGTNLYKDTTAEASATAAATSEANAATSASSAATSATNASNNASSASTSATTAATSATTAAGHVTTAAGHVTTASNWAQKTDGTVDGSGFSAKYWAQQSSATSGIPTPLIATRYLTNDGATTSWALLGDMASRAKATAADLYAWVADKGLTADTVGAAFAPVALAFAATLAWDWRGGYYRGPVVCTANVTIAIPTNIRAGESRMMDLAGDTAAARTVAFAAGFKGPLPSITDLTSTKLYRLVFTADTAGNLTVASEVRS